MASGADRRALRPADDTTRLILLGTGGGAYPKATRCGYANAIVVGDTTYLVDCGEGVHRQLWRAGLTVNERSAPDRPLLRTVFITHLHADHIMDLANLVQGSWPSHPIDIYGPGPADQPIPMFPADAVRPLADPDEPAARSSCNGGPSVTGVRLQRQPPCRQRRARRRDRFDSRPRDRGAPRRLHARRRSRRCSRQQLGGGRGPADGPGRDLPPGRSRGQRDRNARAARSGVSGARLPLRHATWLRRLVRRHRTMRERRPAGRRRRHPRPRGHRRRPPDRTSGRTCPTTPPLRNHLAAAHSSPEQVGDIATRARVRTLVLSHLVPGDGDPSDEEWVARVRPHFDGEIVCGVDLDELTLTRTGAFLDRV